MELEFKAIECELKSQSEGKISGYANVYGIVDEGRDVVENGAFAKSLKGQKFPMLWAHDAWSLPIGVWDVAREDERGLYVEGTLVLKSQKAREVYELVKAGALSGLSIGFKTLEYRIEDEIRYIEEATLSEVSVVTFPMNTQSRIDAVKAAEMTEREIERRLMQDAGFSRSAARSLMKGGVHALQAKQDAGGDAVTMLKSILNEIQKLKG